MAKARPTFKQLRESIAREVHGATMQADALSILNDLEAKCIRLIQIQQEVRELEKEAGYTDPHSGQRHPGIRDEIEREFIILNMFDGVQIEDFIVIPQTGSGPDYIDPIELLRLGVPDETIKAATRKGRGWTSVRVQQVKTKEHVGGAKF